MVGSERRKPGNASTTGVSHPTSPLSTSSATVAALKVLEIEPMSKVALSVSGRFETADMTPKHSR